MNTVNRRHLLVSAGALLASTLTPSSGIAGIRSKGGFTRADVDYIQVRKAARKLELIGGGKILRAYDIRLGSSPVGPKRFLRDGRTPEGIYRIDRRNDQSRFHLSLGISYPDSKDRAYAAQHGKSPGGDIFIHGQPNGYKVTLGYDWTWGCIALSNHDIEELWKLTPRGCKVAIYA